MVIWRRRSVPDLSRSSKQGEPNGPRSLDEIRGRSGGRFPRRARRLVDARDPEGEVYREADEVRRADVVVDEHGILVRLDDPREVAERVLAGRSVRRDRVRAELRARRRPVGEVGVVLLSNFVCCCALLPVLYSLFVAKSCADPLDPRALGSRPLCPTGAIEGTNNIEEHNHCEYFWHCHHRLQHHYLYSYLQKY